MPESSPVITRVLEAAPEPGPLPHFSATDVQVSLGFPEIGTVSVSCDGVTIASPTELAWDAAWNRLGHWASAQWFLFHGYLVLPGAVVEKNGQAVALVGATRVGASATALQLTRNGFGVVSDGIVVVSPEGTIVPRSSEVTLDRELAEILFRDYPTRDLDSGRDRVAVEGPGGADSVLAAFAYLTLNSAVEDISVSRQSEPNFVLESLSIRPLFLKAPAPLESWVIPEIPLWKFSRNSPRSMEHLQRVGPQALSAIISDTVTGVIRDGK